MDRPSYSRASSSKRSLGPFNPAHELPRWRSPSPMTASIIPPPIVQSTYQSSASAPAKSVVLEPLHSHATDRQSELEADLQFLLDAQAEGLIRGYYGGTLNDQLSSNGSATPTVASGAWNTSSSSRFVRPARQKPGLRRARKGIYNRMVALSGVKNGELRQIDEDLGDNEQTLRRIEQWEDKRKRLEAAAGEVKADEDAVRVQRLQEEANTLQGEINRVDLQLMDMKSRHRQLLKQISAVENAVEAKSASYAASLRMLDEEVSQFLSAPPVQVSNGPKDGQASLWQLPSQRRTLDMARQFWTSERQTSVEQRRSIEHEKTALDEAAPIWKETCAHINEFEDQLRVEMAKLLDRSSNSDTAAWDEPVSQHEDRTDGLKGLLQQLGSLIDTLQSRLALAELKSWNLLIAAIGAELDALTKGKTMLEQMLNDAEQRHDKLEGVQESEEAPDSGGSEIHALDQSFETARRRMSASVVADSEDDPDPALLFSRRDDSEPE